MGSSADSSNLHPLSAPPQMYCNPLSGWTTPSPTYQCTQPSRKPRIAWGLGGGRGMGRPSRIDADPAPMFTQRRPNSTRKVAITTRAFRAHLARISLTSIVHLACISRWHTSGLASLGTSTRFISAAISLRTCNRSISDSDLTATFRTRREPWHWVLTGNLQRDSD